LRANDVGSARRSSSATADLLSSVGSRLCAIIRSKNPLLAFPCSLPHVAALGSYLGALGRGLYSAAMAPPHGWVRRRGGPSGEGRRARLPLDSWPTVLSKGCIPFGRLNLDRRSRSVVPRLYEAGWIWTVRWTSNGSGWAEGWLWRGQISGDDIGSNNSATFRFD
jgi:hypothetical protein